MNDSGNYTAHKNISNALEVSQEKLVWDGFRPLYVRVSIADPLTGYIPLRAENSQFLFNPSLVMQKFRT
jgi:hypothetical protein